MVETQLRARGIRSPRVLRAMATVPRERFVSDDCRDLAYADRALPVAFGQTISQPYVVALMTEALQLRRGHRILEVGTGTGYQTAILCRLADDVWTVERIPALSEQSAARLESMGIKRVHFRVGDGTLGCLEAAPFDRIIVTAAGPTVPFALLQQLADPGRLVVPVGQQDVQTLIVIARDGGVTFERPLLPCRFVKLVGEQGWT